MTTNTTTTGITIPIILRLYLLLVLVLLLLLPLPLMCQGVPNPPTRIPILNVVPQSGKKHRLVKLFVGEKKIEKKIMKKKK